MQGNYRIALFARQLANWFGCAEHAFGSNPVAVAMTLYAVPMRHALTPHFTLVEGLLRHKN